MNKKKLLMFGLPLLAVALVSAALLSYFGIITINADIEQSVIIDGKTEAIIHEIPQVAPGGESFCFLHKVKNYASIDIPVSLNTTCTSTAGDTSGVCGGVESKVYEVPETTTLHLESKDPTTWTVNGSMKADLTYDPVNPTFKGTLTTSGLNAVEYALIYYPDQEDRFASDKWNGAGGIVIATFTDDVTGLSIEKDLGINLPNTGDWNINPSPDYCDNHNGFDDYAHCKGAKIWIVPTSDLDSGNLPLKVWNPSSYLFETDLITYSDCTFPAGLPDAVDMVKGSSIDSLNTESKTTTPMLVCYDFDVMIAPGTYTIETQVLPVTA